MTGTILQTNPSSLPTVPRQQCRAFRRGTHLWRSALLLAAMACGFDAAYALQCYDSSYPSPDSKVDCGAEMMCYSEYYAVNRSGTIRQYYDRFCVHETHCLYRGIDENCPGLSQLDHKMQSIFSKHHAKSQMNTILYSQFCCCRTNLCNDVDHKKVLAKYGLQISIAEQRRFFAFFSIFWISQVVHSFL